MAVAGLVGKPQRDMYTAGVLNEHFGMYELPDPTAKPGNNKPGNKSGDEGDNAVVKADRSKRTTTIDKACKEKMVSKADFEEYVDMKNIAVGMLLDGESVIAAIPVVGLRGAANSEHPDRVYWGKGLVVLSRMPLRGTNRMHFLMQNGEASFTAMEAWMATAACGLCCKKHDIKSDYHSVHTQELKYSVGMNVRAANLHMTFVDRLDHGVTWSSTPKAKGPCCRCSCACLPCCKTVGGAWSHSTSLKRDFTVETITEVADATYTFPGGIKPTSKETKAYLCTRVHKIVFEYDDDDGPVKCELWADPSSASLEQVTKFVTQLSDESRKVTAPGQVVMGSAADITGGGIPGMPADSTTTFEGTKKKKSGIPCCPCLPKNCCRRCRTLMCMPCKLCFLCTKAVCGCCYLGFCAGWRECGCCKIMDPCCPCCVTQCKGYTRNCCWWACPCIQQKKAVSLDASSFPWELFPVDDGPPAE